MFQRLADDYPQAFEESNDLRRNLRIFLCNALEKKMTESDWIEFASMFGLEDRINKSSRLIKALNFGDDDYKSSIITLVTHLESQSGKAINYLISIPKVKQIMNGDLVSTWEAAYQGKDVAISEVIQQLQDKSHIVDFSAYNARMQSALPRDPALAIGTSKELLEATFRHIMAAQGSPLGKNVDFQVQMNTTLTAIGVSSTTPATDEADKKVRQIVDSAKKMMIAANELRNLAGTGHGHAPAGAAAVQSEDAQLIASVSIALATWLISKSE